MWNSLVDMYLSMTLYNITSQMTIVFSVHALIWYLQDCVLIRNTHIYKSENEWGESSCGLLRHYPELMISTIKTPALRVTGQLKSSVPFLSPAFEYNQVRSAMNSCSNGIKLNCINWKTCSCWIPQLSLCLLASIHAVYLFFSTILHIFKYLSNVLQVLNSLWGTQYILKD